MIPKGFYETAGAVNVFVFAFSLFGVFVFAFAVVFVLLSLGLEEQPSSRASIRTVVEPVFGFGA
jgi:hypothetical protein